MNQRFTKAPRVLSLYPTTRGFGFAVFEGPSSVIDWGVQQVRSGDRSDQLSRMRSLIEWNAPDVLILENCGGQSSRRVLRIHKEIQAVARLAKRRRIPIASYSRAMIRQCFSRFDAKSKDAIARVIAREFPELEPRLPPLRRPWMSEDYRMGMFDAAALALTHFYFASIRGETE